MTRRHVTAGTTIKHRLSHSAIGSFYTFGLLASPAVDHAQNFSHKQHIATAIIIFGIVFIMALLFWFTAIAVHRRKPSGRKLALISAVAALPRLWRVGIHTWWFMQSEGTKHMYEVKHESV